MNVEVVLLPRDLRPDDVSGRAVVVFDVLRATTTMIAALSAGVSEICVFSELEEAKVAAGGCTAPHVLCGERHAVKPPGFDLGNSPGAFKSELHRGQILFISTTNGTRAILAAGASEAIFIAALVNADAAAEALLRAALDITLLCAGTEGYVSSEDVLGAGAVIEALQTRTDVELASDAAWMARQLFLAQRHDLKAALLASRGGRNVVRAGLSEDITFAAKLNSIPIVGVVRGQPPVVQLWQSGTRASGAG